MDETCSTLPAYCHYSKTTYFQCLFIIIIIIFVHLHNLIWGCIVHYFLNFFFVLLPSVKFELWKLITKLYNMPRDTAATYQPTPLKIMLSAQSWTKHSSKLISPSPTGQQAIFFSYFLKWFSLQSAAVNCERKLTTTKRNKRKLLALSHDQFIHWITSADILKLLNSCSILMLYRNNLLRLTFWKQIW
jgi:hypothetical protein